MVETACAQSQEFVQHPDLNEAVVDALLETSTRLAEAQATLFFPLANKGASH
ncbi:MAG: hypothetical protein ACN6QY_20740 [Pseudomonas sp.]|uniref:hypothetical protein n=1 Tax=Pseudomonas sp. TaxID=306 RepID=UPI003D13E856